MEALGKQRGQPKDMGNGVRENVLLKIVIVKGLVQGPLKQTSHFGELHKH